MGTMMTRRDFAAVGLGGFSLAGCGQSELSVRGDDFHRGVNFTAERPDRYDSENARALVRRLPECGVDSIALVPYGSCREGSTEVRFNGRRSWEKDAAITDLAALARECGMRVLLKPQVWVRRGFPGDIEFSSEDETNEWFASYETFVRHYATLARTIDADLFSVGVEFSKLTRFEERWRQLIALSRELYGGPLLYAANWGAEFESVAFWDALDFIGLNNYYPLPDDLSMTGVVEKVESVQRRFQRPVVFPEAGYPSLVEPHREPWAEQPREISLEAQARCYEAVFEAFYLKPWFQGVYWWKVGSNGFGGPEDGSHTPWGKPAMDVVTKWYLRGRRG